MKKSIPNAGVTAVVPKAGKLTDCLKSVVDRVLIIEDLGVLRKTDLRKRPLKSILNIVKGIRNAVRLSRSYDLVYINTIVVADYILAARMIKPRTIIHVREIPEGIQKPVFSLMLRLSNAVLVFNSDNTRQSYCFCNALKNQVILNGVKGISGKAKPVPIDQHMRFLLLGRFCYLKGQTFFLEAISRLEQRFRSTIKIKLVGDVSGDQLNYKTDIFQKMRHLGLEECVKICPFSDNPVHHYEWADVVVVPSIVPESFGRVAIEAMSAGCCVLAAAHGGLLEIVRHRETGLFFQPGDTDSLAGAVQWLIEHPDSVRTFGNQGKIRFNACFDEKRYIRQLGMLINNQLGIKL
jgi:glycosyltransferase involved in cell wall biosynthesis